MKPLNTFYKYNIKESIIYNMYKMCTDNNNKICTSQREHTWKLSVLGVSNYVETLSEQCNFPFSIRYKAFCAFSDGICIV